MNIYPFSKTQSSDSTSHRFVNPLAFTFAFAFALTLAAALLMPTSNAFAQTKVMRIIVPYAAGGPIDVTARLMAERVKDSLGPVIIENRPGGGGNIGADAIAKATPDGLTIGIAAVATHAINPWLYSKMPYNASTDFAPMLPPPPGRFSMMTGPNESFTRSAIKRAVTSIGPPAAYGTMIRMTLVWANALDVGINSAAASVSANANAPANGWEVARPDCVLGGE